jgi:hypothetical protein
MKYQLSLEPKGNSDCLQQSKAFASSMPYSLYSDLCHQRNWVPAGSTGSNLVLANNLS